MTIPPARGPAAHRAPALVLAAAALTGLAALAGCTSPPAPRPQAAPGSPAAGSPALAATGGWADALQVPGTSVLNKGGQAEVDTLSCASAGNCSAGGFYTTATETEQAFVVSEVHGRWQPAREVPGTAALNAGGDAETQSVSCASAGDCSAVGDYADPAGDGQAFTVSEVHGRWQRAQAMPGLAGLSSGDAFAGTLSCASPGNCAAGGSYTDGDGKQQAFVASEAGGRWQPAQQVPGTAALNAGQPTDTGVGADTGIDSVSCAAAGSCTAGGYYADKAGDDQPFVVSEVHGSWQAAQPVPGTAALSHSRLAGAYLPVSCAAPGDCSASGDDAGPAGSEQAFVADEADGRWQPARELPGAAALTTGTVTVEDMSCASPGNCSAGGYYQVGGGRMDALVASEVDGRWQPARELPGTAALDKAPARIRPDEGAEVSAVSCASPGNCSAGGWYTSAPDGDHGQAFVADEVDGTWQQARELPGIGALDKVTAAVMALSCPAPDACSAGGTYQVQDQVQQAFVAGKT